MKKLLLTLALLAGALGLCLPALPAQVTDALVDKYYRSFHGQDGTAALMMGAELRKEVPSAIDREELYARIIERGAKDPHKPNGNPTAIEWILSGLANPESEPQKWSAHLETAVLAQAHNPDPDVRQLIPEILAKFDKDKYRALCLSYLDDPDDEVRQNAVDAIRHWPDGKSLLRQYVQTHRSSRPGVAGDSVERAKALLGDAP